MQKQKRHLPGNSNMFSRQHLNSIAAPEDRYSQVGLDPDSILSLGANHNSNNSGEIQAGCEAMLEAIHRPPTSTVWKYDSALTACSRPRQALSCRKVLSGSMSHVLRQQNITYEVGVFIHLLQPILDANSKIIMYIRTCARDVRMDARDYKFTNFFVTRTIYGGRNWQPVSVYNFIEATRVASARKRE